MDVADALSSFQLACARCGRAGPDAVEDTARLEQLTAPRLLSGQAAVVGPFGIRVIGQGDIEACRPVHRSCQPRPKRKLPERAGGGRYDIMRSVL